MTDPRALALAQARQRVTHAEYGLTARWENFSADEQALMVTEADTWLRAAVAAGLLPDPPEPDTEQPPVCGFLHDQWDLGIRMTRRCVARAGHTDGGFAYDHGPWEGVSG